MGQSASTSLSLHQLLHLDQAELYTAFVPGRHDAKMSLEALSEMPLVEIDCRIHAMRQETEFCSVLEDVCTCPLLGWSDVWGSGEGALVELLTCLIVLGTRVGLAKLVSQNKDQ